jgi:two-component system response regulator
MPRVNGFEVLAAVKKTDGLSRIPVVVLTSSDDAGDIQRSYDLGANSYLLKPVRFDAFAGLVSEIDAYWLKTNVTTVGSG